MTKSGINIHEVIIVLLITLRFSFMNDAKLVFTLFSFTNIYSDLYYFYFTPKPKIKFFILALINNNWIFKIMTRISQ